MGGSFSAGRSNAELVYNLATQHAKASLPHVEEPMLGVDRRKYFSPAFKDFAYQDQAWRHNNIHLSAPVIYWEVLDLLELKPGLSFLNLGSGTGYLSTMVGLVLGPHGVNHGIELHQEVIDYALDRLQDFKQHSESIDRYDVCEPVFVKGNCLHLPEDVRQYDRVYCGASCPDNKEAYMKNLIKVGGVLVMPYRGHLLQIKRVAPNKFQTVRRMQVAFSVLQDPPNEDGSVPQLPPLNPKDLRDLARTRIRQLLRSSLECDQPEIKQIPRFVPDLKSNAHFMRFTYQRLDSSEIDSDEGEGREIGDMSLTDDEVDAPSSPMPLRNEDAPNTERNETEDSMDHDGNDGGSLNRTRDRSPCTAGRVMRRGSGMRGLEDPGRLQAKWNSPAEECREGDEILDGDGTSSDLCENVLKIPDSETERKWTDETSLRHTLQREHYQSSVWDSPDQCTNKGTDLSNPSGGDQSNKMVDEYELKEKLKSALNVKEDRRDKCVSDADLEIENVGRDLDLADIAGTSAQHSPQPKTQTSYPSNYFLKTDEGGSSCSKEFTDQENNKKASSHSKRQNKKSKNAKDSSIFEENSKTSSSENESENDSDVEATIGLSEETDMKKRREKFDSGVVDDEMSNSSDESGTSNDSALGTGELLNVNDVHIDPVQSVREYLARSRGISVEAAAHQTDEPSEGSSTSDQTKPISNRRSHVARKNANWNTDPSRRTLKDKLKSVDSSPSAEVSVVPEEEEGTVQGRQTFGPNRVQRPRSTRYENEVLESLHRRLRERRVVLNRVLTLGEMLGDGVRSYFNSRTDSEESNSPSSRSMLRTLPQETSTLPMSSDAMNTTEPAQWWESSDDQVRKKRSPTCDEPKLPLSSNMGSSCSKMSIVPNDVDEKNILTEVDGRKENMKNKDAAPCGSNDLNDETRFSQSEWKRKHATDTDGNSMEKRSKKLKEKADGSQVRSAESCIDCLGRTRKNLDIVRHDLMRKNFYETSNRTGENLDSVNASSVGMSNISGGMRNISGGMSNISGGMRNSSCGMSSSSSDGLSNSSGGMRNSSCETRNTSGKMSNASGGTRNARDRARILPVSTWVSDTEDETSSNVRQERRERSLARARDCMLTFTDEGALADDERENAIDLCDLTPEKEVVLDERSSYWVLMRGRIQALPLPSSVKYFLNFGREF